MLYIRPVTMFLHFEFRCCCGRPLNQHGKLTTVQEENEGAEVADEEAEENDSSGSQDEAFELEERSKLVKNQGWYRDCDSYTDSNQAPFWLSPLTVFPVLQCVAPESIQLLSPRKVIGNS